VVLVHGAGGGSSARLVQRQGGASRGRRRKLARGARMSVRERDGVGRARRQAGPGGQRGREGRRAGGERLRCGPAGRSRRRQVGPAAQDGRARGAGGVAVERACWAGSARGRGPLRGVLGRCELGLGRSVGAGWLRRWAGADWAGLGRKEVGRGFGLLGWFFWVPFLFYFFSFPLNSELSEFK